jgi:hypothetical protein
VGNVNTFLIRIRDNPNCLLSVRYIDWLIDWFTYLYMCETNESNEWMHFETE